MSTLKMLNIGCGRRYHKDWYNVDLHSSGPQVLAHDIRNGLPYNDNTFTVCYTSHVLEHFSPSNGKILLDECYRVLAPNGVIRVVVPDLEGIVRAYIEVLDRATTENPQSEYDHRWMVIELFDQMVRERSGGAMLEYLQDDQIPNKEFVLKRLGLEAASIIHAKSHHHARQKQIGTSTHSLLANFYTKFRRLISFLRRPTAVRENFLRLLLGSEYELLQLGRFRRGGEVHLWMYDRFSLARALHQVGFVNPQVFNADESQILNWSKFNLDTEPDGTVYKPDSLYMEACKPTM